MTFKKELIYTEKFPAKRAALEAELQMVSQKYGFCPQVVDFLKGDTKAILEMDDLKAPNLQEVFGEDPMDVPTWIWEKIQSQVKKLFEEEGIEQVDITPQNFLIRRNKIFLVDFGHAQQCDKGAKQPKNWFLRKLLEGKGGFQGWNPDFR